MQIISYIQSELRHYIWSVRCSFMTWFCLSRLLFLVYCDKFKPKLRLNPLIIFLIWICLKKKSERAEKSISTMTASKDIQLNVTEE